MLIGFTQVKSRLLAVYQNHKLPHAILLLGKKGIGKASFARELAEAISKDILVIEKEAEKREIGVERIRGIKDFVNQTSAISDDKFIIIDSACELTRSAANSTLKILEEPNPHNFLILIAHNLNAVLPTIRSRCQIIRIPNLSHTDFAKIVKDDSGFLAEICENSPAEAIALGADLARSYELFLRSILNKKLSDELLKKISDKNFSFRVLEKICAFFFNRAGKFSAGLPLNFYFEEEKVFLQMNRKKIFDMHDEAMLLLRKTTSINLDRKLTLINIFNQLYSAAL
ncbi:MAG: AAA family ATPase [Alphaproteobacteria bacterium]|nr:AAA family ATPase [Alphaproteobacteria bacterium]